jgi:hypothetical protein
LSGCTAVEVPEQAVESHAPQAIEEETASCTIEDAPPAVTLALPDLPDDADHALASDGSLRVTVANHSETAASVSIRLRSRSEAGWSRSSFEAGRVAAGGSIDVSLTSATLDLPAGTFDRAGSLTLLADLALDDGESAQSQAVHVFFHPTLSGWAIYDRAGLGSRHDDGALSETARTERAEIVRRFGVVGVMAASSPERRISESARFIPENDVPVDHDQAE